MIGLVAEFILQGFPVRYVPGIQYQAGHGRFVEQIRDRRLVVSPASVLAQHLQLDRRFQARLLDRLAERGAQRPEVGWMR